MNPKTVQQKYVCESQVVLAAGLASAIHQVELQDLCSSICVSLSSTHDGVTNCAQSVENQVRLLTSVELLYFVTLILFVGFVFTEEAFPSFNRCPIKTLCVDWWMEGQYVRQFVYGEDFYRYVVGFGKADLLLLACWRHHLKCFDLPNNMYLMRSQSYNCRYWWCFLR